MSQDDIISMAREAGFESNSFCPAITRHSNGSWVGVVYELEAFAALVAAAEREACAKVCDSRAAKSYLSEAKSCATAIRARSNTDAPL